MAPDFTVRLQFAGQLGPTYALEIVRTELEFRRRQRQAEDTALASENADPIPPGYTPSVSGGPPPPPPAAAAETSEAKLKKERNPWAWLSVVSVLGGITLWWVGSLFQTTLPSPAEVAVRAWELISDGTLIKDIAASLRRVLLGFFIGSGLALPLGFAMGWYKPVRAIIEPWTQFFRTIPPLAIIPLAIEAFNQAPEQMPDGSVIHHWVGGVSSTARNLINTRDMKIVMSPACNAYLPQVPGPGILGPTWACDGGGCGINQFYNWNPTAQAGVAEASVLGVSAAIWQEHIRSLNSLEYLMYPRLMATAEVGWTPQGERTIADFRERLTTLGTALTVEGRNFFPSDGTWELDVRGAVLPELAEDEAPGVVGWASLHNATDADVSATLEIGGETITLDATAERIYKDGVGAKFDDRQVNSIFVLTTDEALPAGEHTATITVTGKGATKTEQLPITVAAANEAPTLATVGNAVFQAGAAVSIQVVATDPDGDALTYSADGLPAGLAIDGATGLISGTTDAVGDHTVTVTVDDGNGGTATRSFTLTVTTKPTPTEPTDEPTADPTDDPTQQPTTPPVKKYVRTAPYTLAGLHRNLNGRDWNTTCDPYSQTERCRTDIWATIVVIENGQFVRKDGWTFNNLTYLPYMTREAWGTNPLANTGEWTATTDQRRWQTECDTARTGRNGCRSYTFVTVYKATAKPEGGYVFSQSNEWMFNNIVMFE